MFSLVLATAMVIDLPIRRGGSFCANGQCSAPAVQVEKKVEKTVKIETVKSETVFRGGRLRFSLRGSSCCGK